MKKFSTTLIVYVAMIYMTGMMGTRILVPIMSSQLGASVAHVGFIVSTFSILSLLLAIPIGTWMDRYGIRRPLILCTFFSFIALILPFFITNLIGVYLSQIIGGLALTVFVLGAQNYVGTNSTLANRERNVAIFSVGVAVGSFVGPLIAGVLSDYLGYIEAFALLGIFCLLSVFLTLLLPFNLNPQANNVQAKQDVDIIRRNQTLALLKISNLRKAFLVSSFILLAKDIYTAYFPLLTYSLGYSGTTIGAIVALHTSAGVLVRLVMPKLIEKFGRSEVIVSSIFMSGILYLFLPLTDSIMLWGILSFLLGLGLGIGQPLSISTTIQFSPVERVGESLGLRLSFNRLTQVLSPIAFGGIAGLFGISSIFWIVGLLLLSGSPKTYIRFDKNNCVGMTE